jgi:hypothetical protein
MDAGLYTNRGEEVPLGVECALPCCAGSPLPDEKNFPSTEIETSGAQSFMLAGARNHSD